MALGTVWSPSFIEAAKRAGSGRGAETDEAMTTAGVPARPAAEVPGRMSHPPGREEFMADPRERRERPGLR